MGFEVNVCSTAYWPSASHGTGNIPKEVLPVVNKFGHFYIDQFMNKKLDFRMDHGHAEVQVEFAADMRSTLVVSTYQMMVLVAFNSSKILTWRQILDITGIKAADLTHHVLSLVHPDVKVLLSRPAITGIRNAKLTDTHAFMINQKYRSQLRKRIIQLLKPIAQEAEEDRIQAQLIMLQRQHMIDTAIVRIMKTRKKLRHNLLVAEVITQLKPRFDPKPLQLKLRIEALIEGIHDEKFLKRDPDDRAVYEYVA